ncbi:hypothetical protein ACQCSU_05430 [Pseudarthrobacter sp. O4]|uniref:hypothetical protein n=1 Tax=Pseudarthrobacter sp. O4 TaxID=3418417 RepID=UPI003CF47FFD
MTPNDGDHVPCVVSVPIAADWVDLLRAGEDEVTRAERWPISAPPGPIAAAIAARSLSAPGAGAGLAVEGPGEAGAAAWVVPREADGAGAAVLAAVGPAVAVGAGGAVAAMVAAGAGDTVGDGSTAPAGWAKPGPARSATARMVAPIRRPH